MIKPAEILPLSAHILVVDDHEDSRLVARTVLEHAGYSVSLAANGPDALQLAASLRPDLMLLDIVLPELDGLEVTRRLRADVRTHDLRIVAVTALARSTVREDALLAGCNAFLCKPYPVRTLRTMVFEQLLLGRVQAHLHPAAQGTHRIAAPTKGQY